MLHRARTVSASAIAPTSSNGVTSESIDTKLNAVANPALDNGLPIDTELNDWSTSSLSVVVVGASGDLAKKKIFPALFALHYEGLLPKNFQIFGYARSKMTDAEFRDLIARTLTCRIDARAKCAEAQEQFLARCFYQSVCGKLARTHTFDTTVHNACKCLVMQARGAQRTGQAAVLHCLATSVLAAS